MYALISSTRRLCFFLSSRILAPVAFIFMQIEGTGEENIVSFEESYGGLLENFRGYEGIVTVSNNPYNATTVKFDISFFKE